MVHRFMGYTVRGPDVMVFKNVLGFQKKENAFYHSSSLCIIDYISA